MAAHWLGIIRPVNLILLALGMYALDVFVLQPNFTTYGILFTLEEWQFFLLVMAVVLICAGGYMINDYFDQQTDRINKPEKVFIGEGKLNPATVYKVYMLITGIGFGLGVYLSLAIDFWRLTAIFVLAIALLYFYATTFKKVALAGNLIVAFLSALSLLLVFVFEPHLYQLARPGDYYIAELCTRFILTMSFFAFSTTMVREIVKDMEDVQGDRQTGAKTLPVRWGMGVSKFVALIFVLITIGALGYLLVSVLGKDQLVYIAYTAMLMCCMIAIAIYMYMAQSQKQYHRLSTLVKITMAFGIGVLPVYYINTF